MYGELVERDLVLSTCRFKMMGLHAGPSQVQQMALSSWAELRLVPVRLEEPPMTAARQQRAELAMLDGVAPPVAQPTWEAGLGQAVSDKFVTKCYKMLQKCYKIGALG